MNSTVVTVVAISLWAAMLYAILQIATLQVAPDEVHQICGAWGCGPPLQTLVAWHGFCLTLVMGPALAIGRFCSARSTRVLGMISTILGVAMLLIVAVHEAVIWLPLIAPGQPTYFLQRYAYSVFYLHADYPMVPLLIMGVLLQNIAPLLSSQRNRPVVVSGMHEEANGSCAEKLSSNSLTKGNLS
jgi:hypothetical protein